MPSILAIYTTIHVLISLAALLIGVPAISQVLHGNTKSHFVFWFMVLMAVTCLTGFGFPVSGITPAHIIGVVTLSLLALCYVAQGHALTNRRWHRTFLLSAIACQYLNTLVLIVQTFQKIYFLHKLAPTQVEAPFLAAQLLGVSLFIVPVWQAFALTRLQQT